MNSTMAAGEHGLLLGGGRATEREGGARGMGTERPQPGFSAGGRTSRRANGDALLQQMVAAALLPRSSRSSRSPKSVDRWAQDETSSSGESRAASRDPDLPHTDADPPLHLAPSNTTTSASASAPLLSDQLTRLVPFLNLSPMRLESQHQHEIQFAGHDEYNRQQLQPQAQQHHYGTLKQLCRENSYETYLDDAESVSSSTTHYSTAYTVSVPTSPVPSVCAQTFFDPTPSTAGASPTTQHSFALEQRRLLDDQPRSAPTMVPKQLAPEPIDSRLSSSYSSTAGADAMKSTPFRPRSASKTDSSGTSSSAQRSASPFHFWGKKRSPSQSVDHGRTNTDYFAATGRASDDAAYVDSVSNHLGKLTPSTRPGSSGTPGAHSDGRRDWADEADEVENQGPRPTITKEEYLALPLAIQRKYFSASERLQFAQDSDDLLYNHYADLKSPSCYHRKHRPAHSSPETLTAAPDRCNQHDFNVTAEWDDSWVLGFQDKVNKADLTREEQVNLIKHLRASVILEAAANEAFSTSPIPNIDHSTASLSSRRGSLDSMRNAMQHQLERNGRDPMRQSLYDSFRWLDEEEDLDLGLDVDEYHANLREDIPQTFSKRRPSFRRRISISKLPFGRSSMTASRPGSQDSPVSPALDRTRPPQSNLNQRRLSRTLSVMYPSKHFQTDPVPTIDPTAAHYQDPEARQKLRAYLASTSKFDEAVQYGFPATEATQRPSTSEARGHTRPSRSDGSDNMRSFLDFDGDEEEGSIRDDASSLSDPDSPKTPQLGGGLTPPPGHHRPVRSPTDPLNQSSGSRKPALPHKPMSSDSCANAMSSREMTLRMTLTRPDLRANEELIYGWQPQTPYVNAGQRKSQSLPPRSEPIATPAGQTTAVCWSDGQVPTEAENMLAAMDQWGPDNVAGDKNVMKRFWNKVRRS